MEQIHNTAVDCQIRRRAVDIPWELPIMIPVIEDVVKSWHSKCIVAQSLKLSLLARLPPFLED